MKKAFLFSFFATALISATAASADKENVRTFNLSSETFTTAKTVVPPKRTVKSDDSGITVSYSFPEARIVNDREVEGTCFWELDDFAQTIEPGYPSLPVHYDIFAVPDDEAFTVTVTDSAFVDLPCTLTPARSPIFDNHSSIVSPPKIEPIKISDNTFYPASSIILESVQHYRGIPLARVEVHPVKYNAASSTVRAFSSLTYRIEFERKTNVTSFSSELSSDKSINEADHTFLSSHALNLIPIDSVIPINPKDDIEDYIERDPQTYLIISTEGYASAVKRLSDWKRTLGFNVLVLLRKNWSVESVNSAVKQTYANHPSLKYLLIIGSHEDIPTAPFSADFGDYPFYSDCIYGCLDGNDDYIPDIYQGRLVATTISEVSSIIDKIIQYERNPIDDVTFYKKVSCAAPFTYYAYSYREDREYVKTTEAIVRELIFTCSPLRRYWAPSFIYPKEWKDGSAIPDKLLKPTFGWDATTSDIINDINAGCHMIIYRGHGDYDGWISPYPFLSSSNISSLSNYNKLPFVISTTCKTGAYIKADNSFNTSNFSYLLLTKPNSGCIATIASTNNSLTYPNDVLAMGIIKSARPSQLIVNGNFIELKNPRGTCFGEILNQGLLEMSTKYSSSYNNYQYHIYHLFGDPSIILRTAKPTRFKTIDIDRDDNKLTVYTGREKATISLFNKSTNEVSRFYGNKLEFPTTSSKNITVCISGYNKIPEISEPIINPKSIENRLESVYISSPNTLTIKLENPASKGDVISLTKVSDGAVNSTDIIENEIQTDIRILSGVGQYIVNFSSNGQILDSKSILVK